MATPPPEHTVWLNGIAYARIYRIPAELRDGARNRPVPRPNTVPHP